MQGNLQKAAEKLRASKVFINPSDDYRMLEKANIFIVLAGLKPLAEVHSSHWVDTAPGRRETRPDDLSAAKELLDETGLFYQLSEDEHALTAVAALEQSHLDQYDELGNALKQNSSNQEIDRINREFGKLFGIPDTAIEAFVSGKCMAQQDQEKVEVAAGVDPVLSGFRMSKQYYPEELEVVKARIQLLKRYELL